MYVVVMSDVSVDCDDVAEYKRELWKFRESRFQFQAVTLS